MAVFTITHASSISPDLCNETIVPLRQSVDYLTNQITLSGAAGMYLMHCVLYYHPGPGLSEDLDWARAACISPVDDGENSRVMLSMYREIRSATAIGWRVGALTVETPTTGGTSRFANSRLT